MDDDLEEGEVDVDDISAEEQAAVLRMKVQRIFMVLILW